MATESKDSLFVLIKSLSKSEKRQFKLYVGRLGGNSNANFMALFILMDKMKSYDESIILNKTNIKKQQLSNSKAHLYKQILVSLKLSPIHQDARSQIREQIDFASVLYNKGLHQQSLKMLDKAKSMALQNYEHNLAYEIVEREKIIESQYITRSMSNRADELAEQAKELSIRNVIKSKLSNISLQLYSLMLRIGYVKNDDEFKKVQQYFYDRLPDYKIESLGFIEKLYLYKAYLWYSFIIQDFLSSYKYAQKWVDLFDANPEMKKLNPVFYLKGTNYLLESLFLIKHYSKFKEVLTKLTNEFDNNLFLINDNTISLSFLYVYQNKINQYFLKGNFTEGLEFVPEILTQIEQFKDKIDAHHTMVFYYKIACLYFGAGKNEECIYYLDKIITNRDLKMREDLLCFTRVLNLVAHFEAGIDENIDNLIVSTYKFLIKMNDLHVVQKKMISFLKNLNKLYPHDLKGAFKELYKELKQYEDHPYERRSFLYLDILSWLESNIEGVPVEVVIQRKAKKGLK